MESRRAIEAVDVQIHGTSAFGEKAASGDHDEDKASDYIVIRCRTIRIEAFTWIAGAISGGP